MALVPLENLKILSYDIPNSSLKSTNNYKLQSYGDWCLYIYSTYLSQQGHIQTLNDFINQYTDVNNRPPHERIDYNRSVTLLEILEELHLELEEVEMVTKNDRKSNNNKKKKNLNSFDGLPSKFENCVRVAMDGNHTAFVAICGKTIYYFWYLTS
ncbi:hypothetical protein ABK040_005876 [Willaertia magna]